MPTNHILQTARCIVILLETADDAYCILTNREELLCPTGKGKAQGGENMKEAASRILRQSIAVRAPAQNFHSIGKFTIEDEPCELFVARYNMTMGPFVLSEEYIDDDTLDLEELLAIYASSPERLSPLLVCAMDTLRTKH